MRSVKVISVLLIILCLLLFINNCSDSPTESSGGPSGEGSLYLTRVSVAMVPGASEEVGICALNPQGQSDSCTVTVTDNSLVSVALIDTVIQLQGLSCGTTEITVLSHCGLSRTLVVQVYDPHVLDAGELYITYTDAFSPIFEWFNFSLWKPTAPAGFYGFGSYGIAGTTNPNGNRAVIAVKGKEGSNAVVFPTGYEFVGEINSSPFGNGVYHVYRPIPPAGYAALGVVVYPQSGDSWPRELPPLDYVVCVREDLTTHGAIGPLFMNWELWQDMYGWTIEQPQSDPHDGAYLVPGAFAAWPYSTPPTQDAVANVLKIDLPMLAEAPYQTYVPKLTSYDCPPEKTVPMLSKAMLVPCTIITDSSLSQNLHWRLANTPFYRLEREVYYKLLYHNHNQTSQVQTNNVTIISGVTTAESNRFWSETSVSISVEAGVSIFAFSSKVTVTASKSLGYEQQTSIEELRQSEIQSSINTAPDKAAALWQKYNCFVLKRHNGVNLEEVASWEIGIDSYVTDEYPDSP